MQWWRVELDKRGQITGCVRVAQAEQGARFVRYVEAEDEPRAQQLALDWYERTRKQQREYAKRRREKALSIGLCGNCGLRPPAEGRKQCDVCKGRKLEANAQWKANGCIPRPRVDPLQARENKRVIDQRYHDSRVPLRVVLSLFDSLGPEAFRQWLVTEIESLAPQSAVASAPARAQTRPVAGRPGLRLVESGKASGLEPGNAARSQRRQAGGAR